jgi:hypothetical protein
MAFQPAKDAEPIPGYRLVEKLGTGGYGEVWKATAPGGLTKAIKVVYGDMSGARAGQELKALERIKQVRHPFLLSLERFEILDGQLFIVTELADGCLMDRFQECRRAGLKGIPRDELLGHIRDAAEALDYMGETHGLQHLDIKPQNLLLVGGRVKVADFGLVKELVGTSVTATGGVTPLYATPEAFDGRVSRYSDQYSLAIVYQEMLTGTRPFPGITLMQLAAQHTSSPPILQPLPSGDRPPIARALAKVPEQRFPSCHKLAEALLTGRLSSVANPIVTPELIARGKKSGLVPKVIVPAPPTVALDAPPVAPSALLPSTVARPCQPVAVPGQPRAAAAAMLRTVVDHLSPPPFEDEAAGTALSVPDTHTPTGQAGLRPTLFLGLGGLACATLRQLRRRLHRHFGSLAKVPLFRLLLVDTDREALRVARQGEADEALENGETLLAPLHLPDYYRAESKKLLRWLDRRWLYGIPRSLLTEGFRPLGRLALVDNADSVLSQLRDLLGQITQPEAIADTEAAGGLKVRDVAPRVFLVASIAGGSGGGMLLGMAYAVRQVLGELGLSARGLCGLLLHATSPKPADQQMARINACASLQELYHFSQPDEPYPGDPESGLRRSAPGEAPFEDCYLVHLGDELSQAEAVEATRHLADYLFLDTTPQGGAFLDRFRHETRTAPGTDGRLRAFGLSRIESGAPGSAGLDALRCCHRLAELWAGPTGSGKVGKDDKDRKIEQQAEREAVARGLEAETLVDGFRTAIAKQMGVSPESYFTRLNLSEKDPASSREAVRVALDRADQLLGIRADQEEGADSGWRPLEAAVHREAEDRTAQLSSGLLEWLLDLIETPGQRCPAADRAAGWFAQHLQGLTEHFRGELTMARNKANALRQQVLTAKSGSKGGGILWLGRSRSQEDASSRNQKILEYGRLRLREVALANAVRVVGAVQEPLDRFVQELAVCRQQLRQFAAALRGRAGDAEPSGGPASRSPEALPIPAVVLREFDEAMQQQLLGPQGGLWALFSGSHALRRSAGRKPDPATGRGPNGGPAFSEEALREELLARARTFLREALPERNAAQLFLDDHGSLDQARAALLRHLEQATPRLKVDGGRDQLLLGVPDGPAQAAVLKLVAEAIPDLPVAAVGSEEDLFLVYEGSGYPIDEIAVALVGPEAPDVELVRRVMTRLDVSWSSWSPAPV